MDFIVQMILGGLARGSQYSVFQMEYSRNLLFRSGRQMEEIFQALIDRTRAPLDLDRIKTIFGDKHRPHRDTRKKNPTRWGVVVETPTYDLTVFKVHYEDDPEDLYQRRTCAPHRSYRAQHQRVPLGPFSAVLWRYRGSPARNPGEISKRGGMHGRFLCGGRNSG